MSDPTRTITLVLLPGLDGTDVFFRPLLRMLPCWVMPVVIQYDNAPANDYPALLKFVSNAIQDLEDYWLLGWSYSGPLALMLAQQDRRARGVILCASFVRAPHRLLEWCRFAAIAPVIAMVRIGRRVPLLFSTREYDEVRRHKAETLARVSSRTLAARVRAILALDVRHVLARSHVPIVYLAASRDSVVPRRNADDVVRQRPSTRLVTIDGTHMALYTNPYAAAEAICRVLRDEDGSIDSGGAPKGSHGRAR